MGNELDVCSKDQELDEYFQQEHGPEKESIWQFITRSSDRLCTRVAKPRRLNYDSFDLHQSRYTSPIFSFNPHVSWAESEFKYPSYERTIHACFWQIKVNRPGQPVAPEQTPNPVCIIYLHTNMRSIIDALEILPVAQTLGASVMALDWPGCGKSSGHLHGRLDKDIEPLFEWAKALLGENVQIVLWARGMGTAAALALLARLSSPNHHPPRPAATATASTTATGTDTGTPATASEKKARFSFWGFGGKSSPTPASAPSGKPMGEGSLSAGPIKAVVLDSPFTAIQDLVKAAIERMHGKGFTLTKSIVQWGAQRMLAQLSQKLGGLDLFSIQPISFAPRIRVPAFILSATNDDYIPSEHGALFASKWSGPVQCATFLGAHFGPRSADVVQSTAAFLSAFLTIDPQSTPPGPVATMLMQGIQPVDLSTGVTESKEEGVDGNADVEALLPADLASPVLHFVDLEEMHEAQEAMGGVLDAAGVQVVGAGVGAGLGAGLPRMQTFPSFGGRLHATASLSHLAQTLHQSQAEAQHTPLLRAQSLTSLAMRGMR